MEGGAVEVSPVHWQGQSAGTLLLSAPVFCRCSFTSMGPQFLSLSKSKLMGGWWEGEMRPYKGLAEESVRQPCGTQQDPSRGNRREVFSVGLVCFLANNTLPYHSPQWGTGDRELCHVLVCSRK